MRAPLTVFLLLLLLLFAAAASARAQGSEWEALIKEAVSLYQKGQYAPAALVAKKALEMAEKAVGPDHPSVAQSLNILATIYIAQGQYAPAEPLYKRALAIREKTLGPEHPDVATTLNNLAFLYTTQSQHGQAEPLYKRALAIREKALGPDHPSVAQSLNNLALLYRDQGQYAQAEPLYQRALAISEKALGPDHREVAASLNNLAGLYHGQGRHAQAEPLLQRALAIWEKALGPDHPTVAASLNNLAESYRRQAKYAQAEPLVKRSLAIMEKALGPDHPDLATTLNNLALLSYNQGQYAQAEPLYKRSLAILEKALGPAHPRVGGPLAGLGMLYYAQGRHGEAHEFFERRLQNVGKQLEQQFAYMSEKERLSFLDMVSGAFPIYFSFCFSYRDRDPGLIGKMYDALLWRKGLVAGSVAALRVQIAASGDQEALSLLDRLADRRTQLATLLRGPTRDRAQWRKDIERLEQEANEIERELVKRSRTLAEEKRVARSTWLDIRKALAKEEAAVEFVRFPFHDGKRSTGTTYYAALIVTSETGASPLLAFLGEADKLERAPLVDYRERIELRGAPSGGGAAANFYEVFWKPLESALGPAKRIYLSPDGILNLVSWGVVPATDGRLLMEKYDLRIVSNTKDILREKRGPPARSAVLIGNPQFGLDENRQRAVVRSLQKTEEPKLLRASAGSALRSKEQRAGALEPLPGTQAELDAIHDLIKRQNWQVEVYTQERALEEAVKRVQSPRVVHLATHGFFLPDQEQPQRGLAGDAPPAREEPMVRSGLYFAGANRTLAGPVSPAELEDGVLTAYEAMGLNLQGTELVVLSACQTGLGRVKTGEGVFGLRRALQVAGAEAVLMSLWSVPDRETQELMTLFYKKWLAGKSKHQALRESQLELRAKVKQRYGQDLPFYWGAFILVGR